MEVKEDAEVMEEVAEAFLFAALGDALRFADLSVLADIYIVVAAKGLVF